MNYLYFRYIYNFPKYKFVARSKFSLTVLVFKLLWFMSTTVHLPAMVSYYFSQRYNHTILTIEDTEYII